MSASPESKNESPPMTQLEIRKGPDRELRVGGLRLVACRREVGDIDGGITLYVWDGAESDQDPVEILRFDFFRNRPHYHAPAEKQEETSIDSPAGKSVAWGIEAITSRAPELVNEAGMSSIGEGLDLGALAGAGPALESFFGSLEEPNEVSYFDIPVSVLESLNA